MALTHNSSWDHDSQNTNYHAIGDPLAVIYNEGMWQLNNVSPMHNMQYSPVKLKTYALKVKQAIVKSVQASSAKYTVLFEEHLNLKYSEDDASGIMISVKSTGEKNAKSKVSYVALLLSWGLWENLDKAIHLPYMLERGEQRIGTAVKTTLQTLFDCNIRQFTFTQNQLLQFGFNFVSSGSCRGTDTFTLTYKTPQIDHKEKLNLTTDVEQIHFICSGVKDEAMKQSDLVNVAYHILQNQIFHMLMLDIILLDLCEINLPKASVKNNGMVKMKTPEIVNCVFTVLNEITEFHSKVDVNMIMEYDK